ncbi:MAG TPA: histidine--tRNA ligase [Candidatus Paceibacterota bacterium]|nr:histidine--tRNA ligase [Candidatus Paceibacterota bacterium]
MSKKENSGKEAQTLKGMRDLLADDFFALQGFYDKAQEIALYYGFKPIETPILESEEIFTTSIGEGTDIIDKEMYAFRTKSGDRIAMRPEHTASLMRAYIEHGMQSEPQPVMMYHYGPVFRHDNPQAGRYRQFYQFDLDILGSEKSINDALAIKTAWSILEDSGATELMVDVNSIGDKECRAHYVRELTNYYKKHINELGPIDKERLKTNPLRILDSKDEKTIAINEHAPDAVTYLCSACKKHFKEVLEYLEGMGIPYRINKYLVRGLSYYTRTVFEIITTIDGKQMTVCGGGRYDYLAKELGSKKDVPAVGASFGVDRLIMQPWYKKHPPRVLKKPKMFFIQLGMEAKLRSLNVIDILRKCHMPISQTLSKDSLSAQLGYAEKLGVPYALIFGQKEAMENCVIIRDMKTRSQKTVKQKDLAAYLKEL